MLGNVIKVAVATNTKNSVVTSPYRLLAVRSVALLLWPYS